MGPNTWAAARLKEFGPDGRLAWDRLAHAALYVGPMADQLSASSNGGGTSHAWGVRAKADSFGMIDGQSIQAAASGAPMPLMLEAQRAGKQIGLINSASITDAGTGTQLARVANRRDHTEIARQMLEAKPDLLLGGGEQYFLPTGVQGVHGPGVRTDGRNLIEEARAQGYRIVRTRAELEAAAKAPGKVLGLFAAADTFNEGTEEALKQQGLTAFQRQAPRYDEMVAAALAILGPGRNGFYLMAEEEATDNFGGENNAAAVLEAVAGADRAIAHALTAAAKNKALLVLVASDSDCGGLQATGDDVVEGKALPARWENGAPVDGVDGTGGLPFMAAPDRAGRRLPFALSWAADGDMSGGGVARAHGWGAQRVAGTMDSTDIYKALHAALISRSPFAR
jgi:alkaline phosphatase